MDINRNKPLIRIRFGFMVLVFGFLSPLLIPLVMTSNWPEGIKALISGGLAFGIPELFMLLAIAIMGKEGNSYLKRYIRILIRRYGPPDKVSKERYIFGLVLFCIPLIFGFIAPYFLTGVKEYIENVIIVTIGTDVILLTSLFVLGGDFWDKLRSLFIYNSQAVLIDDRQQKP